MRLEAVVGVLLIVGFFSCNPYEKQPPVNIIPRDTIVMIYRDLALAEARFNDKSMNDSLRMLVYTDELNTLRKYGISQARYDTSMKYYRLTKDGMEDIISDVIQQLSKEQVKIEKRLKSAEQEKLEQSSQ